MRQMSVRLRNGSRVKPGMTNESSVKVFLYGAVTVNLAMASSTYASSRSSRAS